MPDRRWHRFAKELRHHRITAGISQTLLARNIHAGASTISAYETARRTPDRATAETLDDAVSAGGSLLQLWDELSDVREIPEGWRDFLAVERQAVEIREYQMGVIPGLLQTKDYMRTIFFSGRMWDSEEQVNSLVKERAQRLDGIGQTTLTFVVDEIALRRVLGGPLIAREQLEHIIQLVDDHRIWFSVIPDQTPMHPGLSGSFRIMSLADGRTIGHEEHLSGVHVVTAPHVNKLVTLFGNLQGEALSTTESKRLLNEIRKDL
jgi:transcriptional regulator with XRE-family HTH domain